MIEHRILETRIPFKTCEILKTEILPYGTIIHAEKILCPLPEDPIVGEQKVQLWIHHTWYSSDLPQEELQLQVTPMNLRAGTRYEFIILGTETADKPWFAPLGPHVMTRYICKLDARHFLFELNR